MVLILKHKRILIGIVFVCYLKEDIQNNVSFSHSLEMKTFVSFKWDTTLYYYTNTAKSLILMRGILSETWQVPKVLESITRVP